MNQLFEGLPRLIFSILGSFAAFLEPTLPYMGICTLLIFADCFTAWQLSRRAHKMHPDKVSPDGKKIKSHHFGLVLLTLFKSYALILMAYCIQVVIIAEFWPIDLPKLAAAAICFWQIWSILENESSCNDAKWAKTLQKILVDKTSRHFDIDLSNLNPDKE